MKTEKISFLSGGQRIDGTLIMPDNSGLKVPGVIFFHGMTSNEERYIPLAQRLAQTGIAGLALSLRGHRTSEGDFNKLTINNMLKDGLAAYDFLINQPDIDPGRIGICGASVGAAIASLVSTERKVKSLVLRAPATYTDEMMKMTFSQVMTGEERRFNQLEGINNTPAVKAIKQFEGNLLVVISENDHIIPYSIPESYFSEAKKSMIKDIITIKGATHNLANDSWREKFIEETIKWFEETL